jgi:hypothetical protein
MGTLTLGSGTYAIYGTEAGADEYLAAKIGSTWAGQTADTKKQALVSATRLIRNYIKSVSGDDVDPETNTDEELASADYELAYALSVEPALESSISAAGNQRRVKAGSAEVEYFRPTAGGRFPVQVQIFLNAWLADNAPASSIGVGMNSGDCEQSSLAAGDFGLTEGY